MKKTFRRLLAICLVLMLAFAVGISATAATPNTTTAELTKQFLVPGGMKPAAGDFTFEFTPVSVKDSATPPPNINNDSAPADHNILKVSYDGNETSSVQSNGYYLYEKKISNILANTTFPHAGIYTYEVEETDATITPLNGTITYSLATYTMVVYVQNGASGIEVSNFVVTRDTDDKGAAVGSKEDMVFINTYNSDTTLTITNGVTGNFADLTKEFTYTINITGASGTTVAARHFDAQGNSTMIPTLAVTGGIFTLKHGEKLVIDALPTTATYDLTQSLAAGYTPGVKVTNDTLNGVTGSAATGASLSIGNSSAPAGLTNPIAISQGTNNMAEWSNVFANNVVTGVFMDILPFIILVVVAIGGFAGYLAMRRRKLNHR